MAFALTAVGASAQLAAGDYIIQNVETGKYLGGANSWGTQASLIDHPMIFTVAEKDGKYTLDSHTFNSTTQHFLGSNGYVDSNETGFTISAVSGGYTLTADGNGYFAGNGAGAGIVTNAAADAAAAVWKLTSTAEILKSPKAGTDMTFLIPAANFSRNHYSQKAWTINANNCNISGGTNENRCAESWRSTFTVSQTISVPNGVYTLNAQAALTDYTGAYDGTDYPVVFGNNVTAPFNNMEQGDQGSNMSQLSNSFAAGKYAVEPLTITVTNGQLNLGVKGTRTDTWCIWDNFSLTYVRALTLQELKEGLAETISEAQDLLQEPMNKAIRLELAKQIEAAQNAKTEAAFTEAAANLGKAVAAAQESADIYAEIAAIVATLDGDGQDAFAQTTTGKMLASGEYTNASYAADLATAAKAQQKDNADMTLAIVNPGFELGNQNGWTVKDNTEGCNALAAANNGNFAGHKGGWFVEKWVWSGSTLKDCSMMQTIEGLPNGTYTLTCDAQNYNQYDANLKTGGFYIVANGNKHMVSATGTTQSTFAVSLDFDVVDGTATFGAQLEGCTGNWICVDNFGLTFKKALVEDPNDMSDLIKNAKMKDSDGWNITGANFYGNPYNVIHATNGDNVDVNQTIVLPAGQYAIYSYAYELAGFNDQPDYNEYVDEMKSIHAGKDTHNALMYVKIGNDKQIRTICNAWDGATPFCYDEADKDEVVRFLDPETNTYLYAPLASEADTWFNKGEFRNEMVFDLPSQGAVTFGIEKNSVFVCENHKDKDGKVIPYPEDELYIGRWRLVRLGESTAAAEPETDLSIAAGNWGMTLDAEAPRTYSFSSQWASTTPTPNNFDASIYSKVVVEFAEPLTYYFNSPSQIAGSTNWNTLGMNVGATVAQADLSVLGSITGLSIQNVQAGGTTASFTIKDAYAEKLDGTTEPIVFAAPGWGGSMTQKAYSGVANYTNKYSALTINDINGVKGNKKIRLYTNSDLTGVTAQWILTVNGQSQYLPINAATSNYAELCTSEVLDGLQLQWTSDAAGSIDIARVTYEIIPEPADYALVHEPELTFVQEETEGNELSSVTIKPVAELIYIAAMGDGAYGNFTNRRSEKDNLVWPYMGDFIGSESKIALDVKDGFGNVVGQARFVYDWQKRNTVTVQVVEIGQNEYGQTIATPATITEGGEYSVIIPAKFFAVYDETGYKYIYDKAIEVKYTVTTGDFVKVEGTKLKLTPGGNSTLPYPNDAPVVCTFTGQWGSITPSIQDYDAAIYDKVIIEFAEPLSYYYNVPVKSAADGDVSNWNASKTNGEGCSVMEIDLSLTGSIYGLFIQNVQSSGTNSFTISSAYAVKKDGSKEYLSFTAGWNASIKVDADIYAANCTFKGQWASIGIDGLKGVQGAKKIRLYTKSDLNQASAQWCIKTAAGADAWPQLGIVNENYAECIITDELETIALQWTSTEAGSIDIAAVTYEIVPGYEANTTGIESIENGSLKDGKYLQNGKIVIVKNGKAYNITGVRVK